MSDMAFAARSEPRMAATASGDHRLAALDGLRGVAILLVILGHYLPGRVVEGELSTALGSFGVGNVVLFFLLSGFLIERNLLRQPNLVAYGLRRACRILPAYWVCLVVLLVLHRILMHDKGYAALPDFTANALLMTDVLHAQVMSGVFWTLMIEVKFYVLAPLITLGGRRAIMTAPFVAVAANALVFAIRGEASHLLTYLVYCLVGMNFALWHRREMSSSILVAIVAMAAIAIGVFSPYYKVGQVVFTIVNAAMLALALTRGLAIPGLPFIGAVSYIWYLYHAGLGYPLMATLEAAPYSLSAIRTTFVAAGLTLTVAWMSYIFIERPAIEKGRQVVVVWLAGWPTWFGWRTQK